MKVPDPPPCSIQPTTSTSNLLPILTALSSSDDQLSEVKAVGVGLVPPRKKSVRKILSERSEVSVRVPHPEDESFQTFFKKQEEDQGQGDTEVNLGSVTRDGELLIMKKHMPILRRKSSGKSRNPLKVLAARMDFKNQKYTETLSTFDTSGP